MYLLQGGDKSKKEKNGISLVDLAYRRAKALKAKAKAGKKEEANRKSKRPAQRTQSRTDEMRELFQSDMSEKKQKRNSGGMGKKKSKNSFKSKSRYGSNYKFFPRHSSSICCVFVILCS